MSNRIAPKLLAEFIGTFAFVFIGAGTAAIVGEGVGLPGIVAIALAHGLAIMAFAFAYGFGVRRAYEPAVTVGVLAAGAMGVGEAIGYIVSQLIGGVRRRAVVAKPYWGERRPASACPHSRTTSALGATTLTITPEAGFMIEALLAFFLVTVVLSTAVAGRAGSLAPLAIGMTLTFNILRVGALTGAPFKPGAGAWADGLRPAIFSDAWLYLTAPIVGAIVAALLQHGPRAARRREDDGGRAWQRRPDARRMSPIRENHAQGQS